MRALLRRLVWPDRPHFMLFSWMVWPLQVLFARFETPPPPPQIRSGTWIVVANHRSMYDVMIGMVLFRRWRWPITMLVNDRYFTSRLYAWIGAMTGSVAIDPDKPLQALRDAKASLTTGRPVLIMPEGQLAPAGTPRNDLLPLEPGAAMLATKHDAGVIIGALWGSDDVWPADRRLPPLRRPWRRPTVRVSYELIEPGHGMDRNELTASIERSLRCQLTALAATAS